LIALRWTDVDLVGATVSIERGIVSGPHGLVEKGTKTHSARHVSLDSRTMAAVADHRERMIDRAEIRHFVATQLLSAGVDVRTVAGRLGHRNAATTLNVYAHFVEQTDRAAADIMGGVLRDGA
jgi:integrase